MPAKQRKLLLLHRIDGLSYAEIAAETGRSKSGVKKIVDKALLECELALEAAYQDKVGEN